MMHDAQSCNAICRLKTGNSYKKHKPSVSSGLFQRSVQHQPLLMMSHFIIQIKGDSLEIGIMNCPLFTLHMCHVPITMPWSLDSFYQHGSTHKACL